MPEAETEVGDTGEATLMVAKTGAEPVLLGGGFVMGSLEKSEVVQSGCHEGCSSEVCVSAVQVPVGSEHVKEQLQHALKLDVTSQPSEEYAQLFSLVMSLPPVCCG